MDIFALIDEARGRINVLEHPFYQRWSAGELAPEELDFYAGEYRHAVVALAEVSGLAAEQAPSTYRKGLARHAEEERAHVELWDDFARAVSAADGAHGEPLTQTLACTQAWTSGRDALEHLAVLYTVEASQPAISTTKLAGLRTHYALDEDATGTAYFTLHAKLDVEHARQARELIGALATEADTERLLARAEAALQGNWTLLDGVQERGPALVA